MSALSFSRLAGMPPAESIVASLPAEGDAAAAEISETCRRLPELLRRILVQTSPTLRVEAELLGVAPQDEPEPGTQPGRVYMRVMTLSPIGQGGDAFQPSTIDKRLAAQIAAGGTNSVLALAMYSLGLTGHLPARFRKAINGFVGRFKAIHNPDENDIRSATTALQSAIGIMTKLNREIGLRMATNQSTDPSYFQDDGYDSSFSLGNARKQGVDDPGQLEFERKFDLQLTRAYHTLVGKLGGLGVDAIRKSNQEIEAISSLQVMIDQNFFK